MAGRERPGQLREAQAARVAGGARRVRTRLESRAACGAAAVAACQQRGGRLGADEACHREAWFLPGGYRLLSAAELAEDSRGLAEVMSDLGFASLMGSWWHPQWVLFGRHVAGDGMAIGQRPGPGQGAVGEFGNEGGIKFTVGASLGGYVAKAADSVDNGTVFLGCRPFVGDDGSLGWDVIDAVDEDC